jgi:hypothetical protein
VSIGENRTQAINNGEAMPTLFLRYTNNNRRPPRNPTSDYPMPHYLQLDVYVMSIRRTESHRVVFLRLP